MTDEAHWVVVVTGAPAAAGFLARLFGADPQAELIRAIRSLTALDAKRARALLQSLPQEVGRFAFEQEARVAAQTLEDAGATWEVREA